MSFSTAQRAVIVDASAAIHILSGDVQWLEAASEWANSGAMLLAPSHFQAEVANALLRSVRMPAYEIPVALHRLEQSGIESADRGFDGLIEAVRLADKHRLTVYDALYLQLAIDIDGELATLDTQLRDAAAAESVPVNG